MNDPVLAVGAALQSARAQPVRADAAFGLLASLLCIATLGMAWSQAAPASSAVQTTNVTGYAEPVQKRSCRATRPPIRRRSRRSS